MQRKTLDDIRQRIRQALPMACSAKVDADQAVLSPVVVFSNFQPVYTVAAVYATWSRMKSSRRKQYTIELVLAICAERAEFTIPVDGIVRPL